MKEGKKLRKYNDLSKTPVKRGETNNTQWEKLIENWTLEERLAGNNGYKKSQGSESDLTKTGM